MRSTVNLASTSSSLTPIGTEVSIFALLLNKGSLRGDLMVDNSAAVSPTVDGLTAKAKIRSTVGNKEWLLHRGQLRMLEALTGTRTQGKASRSVIVSHRRFDSAPGRHHKLINIW